MISPIKSFRLANNLTQSQLADICSVTPQVVLLAEQGLYTRIPTKIKAVTSVTEFSYHEHQLFTRRANKPLLEPAVYSFAPVAGLHRHVAFRRLVKASMIGYCKVLVIAPQIVRNYELRPRGRLLPLIREFLGDAGFNGEELDDLEVRFGS